MVEWAGIFPENAIVARLVTNGNWNEHVVNLPESSLKEDIMKTSINRNLAKDHVIWILNSSGEFSAHSAYQALSNHADKVHWH
ncbi:hypothetical protein FRX31_021510, partial [Thalictrum thalictroides]